MDPNDERLAESRADMGDADRAEFDDYVRSLPEGSPIYWRCKVEDAPGYIVL